MRGSTCHFKSRVPTKLELDAFPRIVMTLDELLDLASPLQQRSLEEKTRTRLALSAKINQEMVCDPSEPQMEFNEPEPDKLLIGALLPLILETTLPVILSSLCGVTHSPENVQEDPRNISAIGSKTRHCAAPPEELSQKWRVSVSAAARQALKATAQRGTCATLDNGFSEGCCLRVPVFDRHQQTFDRAGAKLARARDEKRAARLGGRVPVGRLGLEVLDQSMLS